METRLETTAPMPPDHAKTLVESAATQFYQVDGYRMAYHDSGAVSNAGPDPKPTILCVHGNPTWSYYFRAVEQAFSDRFRVVRIDHLGCGESEKPSRRRYGYRLSQHQANLHALVEHLDLSHVLLLAHDWGGAIGLGSLLRGRDRYCAIALLNTAAFPPPYIPLRIAACRLPWLGTLAVRGANLFARAAIRMAMSRQTMDAEVAARLLSPYDSWSNRVAIDSFVRDIPMTKRHPTYPVLAELERALPSLDILPSLLIWGMKDWCFRPECLRRFQEVWPDATTVEISDAGHYVMEDATDEVIHAIDRFINDRLGCLD